MLLFIFCARTTSFLSAADDFARKQQTCRFFMDELLNGVVPANPSSSSSSKDSNDFNGIAVYSALVTNLQKQAQHQEEQFCIRCDTLKSDADEAIQLHESFHCTVNAIESRKEGKGFHLPLLDQGVETNKVILGLVSSFAGVESDGDISDWNELRSLLAR